MAARKEHESIEGAIGGKPISPAVRQKIKNTLKSALEEELKSERATVGVQGPVHFSIHNSHVIYVAEK
jgi:hypothetical protein